MEIFRKTRLLSIITTYAFKPTPNSNADYYILTVSLAQSARFIALLAKRRGLLSSSMAIMEVPQPLSSYPQLPDKDPFREPPLVLVTPCDPWPRPYFLENGLRRVAPYHFTYNTYCKQRWRGRELLDIFSSEFRDRPLEYYVGSSIGNKWNLTDNDRKMP